MSSSDLERWNAKYAQARSASLPAADNWLIDQVSPLRPGRALEFACGFGQNAIWLARQGWQVDAVDISPVGLSHAGHLARAAEVEVNWIAADLDEFTGDAEVYDLVVVFRFLDRARLPAQIERALKAGGRLVYETFTVRHLARPESHMKNPAFALQPGELPTLFPGCDPLSYAECSLPDRDVARLVAERGRKVEGVKESKSHYERRQ
ncbi:MAG: class I SAM-dependent methyltransferase [Planctomycetia bacterium]|nr:class I SAM-dependent methyltransferase [Planctomycetia bacterium]